MKLMKVTIPARLGRCKLAAFAAMAFVFAAAGVPGKGRSALLHECKWWSRDYGDAAERQHE